MKVLYARIFIETTATPVDLATKVSDALSAARSLAEVVVDGVVIDVGRNPYRREPRPESPEDEFLAWPLSIELFPEDDSSVSENGFVHVLKLLLAVLGKIDPKMKFVAASDWEQP